MLACPQCRIQIPDTANFCGRCGQKLASFCNMPVGTRIGNYLVERRLAVGGIGAVYLARHQLLEQKVALKVHDFFAMDKYVGIAFRRAANYLTQLHHPHIVHLYDYGIQDSKAYQAIEYIDGHNLYELIPNQQTSNWVNSCIEYVGQMLSALFYAHNCQYRDIDGTIKRSIFHGDIKPHNIMLDRQTNTIKFTDFMIPDMQAFLSKNNPNFENLDYSTAAFGTPSYMSKEQAEEGKVTQQTDIYSLGITMYQMFTGTVPRSPAIFYGLAVGEKNPYVPSWLDNMIRMATNLDPSKRFSTVAEMQRIFFANYNQGKTEVIVNIGSISNVSGQLFIGKFNDVIANLNTVQKFEHADILKTLKEVIMASRMLPDEKKQEQIEIINQIGEEVIKPKPNKTLLKMLSDGLVQTLQAIPDIARVITTRASALSQLYM